MNVIEIAWVRKGKELAYVTPDIEALIGWTAEEVKSIPIESFVAPKTLTYLKENCFVGEPGSYITRLFPCWLKHRDGSLVCCRCAVVCHYDGSGDLDEACGSLNRGFRQHLKNCLLDLWEQLGETDLEMLGRMVEAYT